MSVHVSLLELFQEPWFANSIFNKIKTVSIRTDSSFYILWKHTQIHTHSHDIWQKIEVSVLLTGCSERCQHRKNKQTKKGQN